MQDAPVLLSTLLKQLREARGLKQGELAERAGITPGMIGHVESGTRSLSEAKLDDVADALDLSPGERDQLILARKRTSNTLFSRKPLEPDLVLQKLNGIETAIRELTAAIERSITPDHPAGRSTPPKVVPIERPLRKAAKKKTPRTPD